jgi:F-type H+-transporting ATPase subunit O
MQHQNNTTTPRYLIYVQPPIQMHSLDGRYASALYTAATKSGTLTNVESDLKKFTSALQKDAKFQNFLESPVVDRAQKSSIIASVATSQGFNKITTNFFALLGENGRLDLTPKVLQSFATLMAAHRGEVSVVVTSSQELDARSLNRVKEALTKGSFLKSGQSFVMSNKVNPSIMGGLIVEVGDQTIDMSVSTKVAKIQKALSGTTLSFYFLGHLVT